jgi:hypothetical protein
MPLLVLLDDILAQKNKLSITFVLIVVNNTIDNLKTCDRIKP